jgi:Xaa-Pro dipeptidase
MNSDLSVMYKYRRNKVYDWLIENEISTAIFQDSEAKRDPAIRYLTGHPNDALLVLTANGEAVLLPWDENMAQKMAHANMIIPFTKFKQQMIPAVKAVTRKLGIPFGTRIELPPTTSYPDFLQASAELDAYTLRCREADGVHQTVKEMRAVKDEYEILCIREAAKITDELIDLLEAGVKSGKIISEIDAALLIERECRFRGCDGTSFDTLAAGPERSFGIHCFPPYTGGAFATNGMSILDFGVTWQGYRSDVTLTFLKGALTPAQEQQVSLIEHAYEEALQLYKKNVPLTVPAYKVSMLFSKEKRKMPHGLGHGIGLEIHEDPFIRETAAHEKHFRPGMVVTLEPGLYDPILGGCRWENDVLITETGNEMLTHSRIIRI